MLLALISILLGLPVGNWTVSSIFEDALGDNYDFKAYMPDSVFSFSYAFFLP